jgi:TonB family protein
MSTQAADPLVLSNAKSADSSQAQPVGAEIPVLIQGSRPAAPNQRPQPFVEESRTVIVFPRGAVLRISGIVSAGQLLILKNVKTNAEIACRVIKANEKMKGYYEVDFTQPEPGFWGIDFSAPGAAVLPASQSAKPESSDATATQADLAASTDELMEDLDRALASAFASLPKAPPKSGEPAKPAGTPAPKIVPPASSTPASPIAIADSVGNSARVASPVPRSSPVPESRKKAATAAEAAATAEHAATETVAKQPATSSPKFEAHAAPAKSNWTWVLGGVAAAAVLLAAGAFVYRTWLRAKPTDLLPAVTSAANSTQAPQSSAANPSGGASLNSESVQQSPAGSAADPSANRERGSAHSGSNPETEESSAPIVTATASRRSAILDTKMKAPASPKNASNKLNADPSSLTLGVPSQTSVQAANLSNLVPGAGVPAPPPEAPMSAPARVSNFIQAKLVTSVPPIYPQMAAAQGLQGDVKLDLTINENGKVTDAKVISGPGLLRQAASDAARQWKYSPAKLDGSTIATHVNVVVHFQLNR